MPRIATVDVGTNTALLLVTDFEPDGRLRPVYEEERFTRLGEGVDAARRLRPAAMERVCEALAAYRARAEARGAAEILVCGTSASRDAGNRAELQALVRDRTGLSYEILSGEEEAAWTFRGAVSAFPGLEGPCVVLDVGGGSTEVVRGRAGPGAEPLYRVSLDVGAVRLTERFFSRLPPPPAEVRRAAAFLDEQFQGVEAGRDAPLIGCSGTLSALALLHAGRAAWSELLPPQHLLSREEVSAWRERLLAASQDEVLALNPAVLSGRADVFAAGVLIADRFMERFGFDRYRASPRGLRHGLALRWHRGSR